MAEHGLIADVGGTNIRLALVELKSGKISTIKKYRSTDFDKITTAISHYLAEVNQQVATACIAIACPTDQDLIQMTNHAWSFSKQLARQTLHLDQFHVINDYTAIALSLPVLNNNQKVQIGGSTPQQNQPMAVYGPGTGLGVAHLINHNGQWLSLAGEGGHVDFAPQDAQEQHIHKKLQAKYGHVSIERLLSGPGLEDIYQAIATYQGVASIRLSAPEITTQAQEKTSPVCQEALAQFCRIMGSVAGNLALTMATSGGVYIAGGIVPRFIDFFSTSEFRTRFEAKGRFHEYLKRVPVFVITEEQPGLLGAAVYLSQA